MKSIVNAYRYIFKYEKGTKVKYKYKEVNKNIIT